MRLRPRTWFIVSLLLFAAAAFFWHLGEKRRNAARREANPTAPAARSQGFTLTNTLVSAGRNAGVSPKVAPAVGAGDPLAKAAALANARTNPFAYRLTNTSKTVAQLMRDTHGVLLRNALLDTASRTKPAIPDHLRAKGDPGSYIVQSRGAINDFLRRRIAQSGAEVVSYIPNNALLVRANESQARKIGASPQVQAVLPYEPYYKLDTMLLPFAVEQEPSPFGELNVTVAGKDVASARAAIEEAGGEVHGDAEQMPFGLQNFVVKAPARALAAIAQIPQVFLVGVHAEKRLANDLARLKTHVSTNATLKVSQGSHYLGLSGSNVLVVITDSGADAGHPDLRDDGGGNARIINLTTELENGHGTHVSGTILGNGAKSDTVGGPDATNSYAQGSTNGANFSGMAPHATGYVHYYRLGTDEQLQREAFLSGALIDNNSWGYTTNDYDIFAASYDAAVRDSLPRVTGEQQMTYVFSAGNDGGPSGSILSPATGKNVITVGASENFRHITNETWKCTTTTNASGVATTTCVTNRSWFAETDSDNQVAPFSSRGNVGIGREGDSGRFKPDVVAPGSFVVSCRSSNFVDPVGSISIFETRYNFEELDRVATNRYSAPIPRDCIGLDIFIVTNTATTVWTSLWVNAAMNGLPTGGPLGSNDLANPGAPALSLDKTTTPNIGTPGTLYFTIHNISTNLINYDVIVHTIVTNDVGNYWEKLKELNDQLAPWYRYESGTSMSAGVVSGLLALMQEFYRNAFNVTNSPALNKALLINGARSLSTQYNLDPHASANNQGWGVVNISNSAPAALQSGTNQSLFFFDQSTNTALATGDQQIYTVTVPPRARSSPLRITLAWTDPAGNPVAGPKLVNDLDLWVDGPAISVQGSNVLSSTNRWIGNNFASGTDFTAPIELAGTNGSTTNLNELVESVSDRVNNVENVYIAPPLGDTYTIVVKGHRVNVNAVNSHTNGIVQDYALVISSGNVVTTNSMIGVSGPVYTNDPTPFFTMMQRQGATNGVALINQRVGASSPYLTTTNGMTNQWSFFLFTNATSFTNVAILTFMAPNLGFLRPDTQLLPGEPRTREGDIDLYVSRSANTPTPWNITNLDSSVISASDRSTRRGGTEFVIYSNAQPGEAYYIGVKAEDQQAALFGIFAVATEKPLSSQDDSNNIIAQALYLPVYIPDGSPDAPGGTNIFAFVIQPEIKVQRVYVTNIITHEDAGDLIGILSHTDDSMSKDTFVTLNNHRYWSGTEIDIYDDSGQDDITDPSGNVISIPTDGPGSLNDFMGADAFGPWMFTISDNALLQTGSVDGLTIVIEPASTNKDLPVDITRRILPGHWLRAAFDVDSPDITNAHICVEYINNQNGQTVSMYVRRGQFPTIDTYDKAYLDVPAPNGDCMDLSIDDSPPLNMGRYYVGVFNPPANSAITVRLTVRLDRNLNPVDPLSITDNTPVPLIDDAATNAVLNIATQALVSGVEVDVRLDHPRASDLVLYLVNPSGTRVMLAENRGSTNGLGYGFNSTNSVYTNFGARVFDNGFESFSPLVEPGVGSTFSGWTVESGNIDVLKNGDFGLASHTGTNCIDINGSVPGVISTNVVLVPGRPYLLSFAYTRNPDGAPAVAQISVSNVLSLQVTDPTIAPWTNLQWKTTSAVFRVTVPTNRIEIRSISSGRPESGVLFDTIRIDEAVVSTNSTLYATFTDDLKKFPTPLKFAIPPFGDTNFWGTNVFVSGFEWGTNGVFSTNSLPFDGWLVTNHTVYLQSNSALAYSDTNFVFLRTGAVTRTIATVPGKEYVLQFATKASGQLIYNTGVDQDNIPLEFAQVDSHYAFSNAGSTVRYSNAWVLTTNVLFPVGWYSPTNGDSRWIGVDTNSTTVPPGDVVYRTQFDLRGYDTNFVRLQCDLSVGERLVEVRLNGVSASVPAGGNPTALTGFTIDNTRGEGFRQRNNTLEIVVHNNSAYANGLRAQLLITGRLLPRGILPIYTAIGQVKLGGVYTNSFVAASDVWRMQSVTFVATTNNTVLEFTGLKPGVWIDHVEYRETGRKYYLPEEPFAPLIGQPAFGNWQLQIWDSRLGAVATNVTLLSWRLNLAYVHTNPPFTRLLDAQPVTAGTPVGGISYFVVDVPCDAATITHAIANASGPYELWFDQNTFPTRFLPGDVLLPPPPYSLTVGFYPLLRSGRYYLGVYNPGPQPLTFTITADLDTNECANAVAVQSLAVGKTSFSANGLTMTWTADPGAEFVVQYSSNPAGPWTTISTTVTSTNGTFTFTDNGSQTGGLPPFRFYRLQRTK